MLTRTLPKAYAYHVAKIEVLTGNLANHASGTGPHANTSIGHDILLKGVFDVNGAPLLSKKGKIDGVKWMLRNLEEHTDDNDIVIDKVASDASKKPTYGKMHSLTSFHRCWNE